MTAATEALDRLAALSGPDDHLPWTARLGDDDDDGAEVFDAQGATVLDELGNRDAALITAAVNVLPQHTAALRLALSVLEDMPCQFWACEGPDVEPEAMVTCYVCRALHDLRAALSVDTQHLMKESP